MTQVPGGSTGDRPSDRPLEERIDELQRTLEGVQARLDAHLASEAALAAAAVVPSPAMPVEPGAPSYWVTPGRPPASPSGRPAETQTKPGGPVVGWGQATTPTPGIPQATAGSWTAPRPSAAPFSRASMADLEERMTGRVLAWVGGFALIAGAILFLSLAFSRGWIGPETRVLLGLAGGLFALGLGAWLFEEARQRQVAHVLVAIGLGTISLALIAATRLYALIPVEVGLAGSMVAAIAAAAIAIRANSQAIAGFGLLAVLAAPPLMGASPDLTTVAFMGTALVGTTIISLFRSWPRLSGIAFVLSAPQLAGWLRGPDVDVALGLTVLGLFWLINEVAAAGEEIRRRHRVLRPATAMLVLANAAFLVAAGFVLLDGSLVAYRGAFLAVVALVHFAVGAWFLRTEGDRHLFGLLVTGTGLAALTIAVPVQFGGPVVPVAWAAEAVALAWIRVRRDHTFSGSAAVVLWCLAIANLLLISRPLRALSSVVRPEVPFSDPAGLAAAFVIGSFIVGAWLLRVAWERASALGAAVLLAVYVLPFEVSGVAVLVGWAALGVGAIGLDRRGLPQHRPLRDYGAAGARATAALEWSVWYAGAVAFVAALDHALVVELPFDALFGTTLPAIPFLDAGGLAIVVLTVSALAIGVLDGRSAVRAGCGLLAAAIVAYGVIFELPVDAVVIVWSGLAVVCAAIAAERGRWKAWWLGASDTLLVLGAGAVLLGLAPLSRLVVDADRASDLLPFLNGPTIAIGAVVAALLSSARLLPNERWTPIRVGAAAVAVVYLLSIGVVDLFQARLGGAIGEEELAKQAQVALSALWGILGATAFGIGLVADLPRARQAGLVLLGVVTVKVFLVDLAALDVAYRVLSLLALGVVLLASAYLFARFRPSRLRV